MRHDAPTVADAAALERTLSSATPAAASNGRTSRQQEGRTFSPTPMRRLRSPRHLRRGSVLLLQLRLVQSVARCAFVGRRLLRRPIFFGLEFFDDCGHRFRLGMKHVSPGRREIQRQNIQSFLNKSREFALSFQFCHTIPRQIKPDLAESRSAAPCRTFSTKTH